MLGLGIGAGPLPLIGNLILHLVYGASLGALYGPLGDIPADQFPGSAEVDSPKTVHGYEDRMAQGIVTGAILGAAIGIFGLSYALSTPGTDPMGAPPLAFLVVSILLGANFGCFIGAMLGLAPEETY